MNSDCRNTTLFEKFNNFKGLVKSMIGFIGAMQVEVAQLCERMKNKQTYTAGGIVYEIGELCDCPVVVARCGEGKVAAAMCAQTMILKFNPSMIINIDRKSTRLNSSH